MKISEIRQIPVAELAERIADEVAKYNQLLLNHSISPLEILHRSKRHVVRLLA